MDLHIRCLTLRAAERLMDHDLGIRQRNALALRAGREQECAHGRSHADADGGNVTLDILHGVIDRHAVCDAAAGAVDIELNVLIGILRFEIEHLRDDQTCRRCVDFFREHNDAVVEQARENIIRTFAAAGLFNNIRNQTHN